MITTNANSLFNDAIEAVLHVFLTRRYPNLLAQLKKLNTLFNFFNFFNSVNFVNF